MELLKSNKLLEAYQELAELEGMSKVGEGIVWESEQRYFG